MSESFSTIIITATDVTSTTLTSSSTMTSTSQPNVGEFNWTNFISFFILFVALLTGLFICYKRMCRGCLRTAVTAVGDTECCLNCRQHRACEWLYGFLSCDSNEEERRRRGTHQSDNPAMERDEESMYGAFSGDDLPPRYEPPPPYDIALTMPKPPAERRGSKEENGGDVGGDGQGERRNEQDLMGETSTTSLSNTTEIASQIQTNATNEASVLNENDSNVSVEVHEVNEVRDISENVPSSIVLSENDALDSVEVISSQSAINNSQGSEVMEQRKPDSGSNNDRKTDSDCGNLEVVARDIPQITNTDIRTVSEHRINIDSVDDDDYRC